MEIRTFQVVNSIEIASNRGVCLVKELDDPSSISTKGLLVAVVKTEMISRATQIVTDMQIHGPVFDSVKPFPNKGLD